MHTICLKKRKYIILCRLSSCDEMNGCPIFCTYVFGSLVLTFYFVINNALFIFFIPVLNGMVFVYGIRQIIIKYNGQYQMLSFSFFFLNTKCFLCIVSFNQVIK